jgi:hypothetical protein
MLEAIRYYAGHPVEFAVDNIGVVPDPVQAEIMRSVAANPLTSVRSGHGIGKSAVEAWLIIWFLCTRPYPKVPCTAPTRHQLYDILWAEVAKWIRNRPELARELVWTADKLYMRGHPENWFAVPRTATKPEALQGFHADHVLYIVDEASGVPDDVFAPVLGALSTPGARLLMCGNPTRLSGFFYDSHHKSRPMYATFHVDGRSSPRVSQEFVRMIIGMFGEDSDVFRVRVSGDFPKAMPDSFIPMEWAERNSRRTLAAAEPRVIDIGVDVARFGDDESVLCPVFDKRVQQCMEVCHHNDTMELTGRVVQLVQRYREKHPAAVINVKVDCDGLGVGVYDRLREKKLPCRLFECHFGGRGGRLKADDPVEMANSTGLMWGHVRERLRVDALALVYDDRLISQLSNRKYRVGSDGRIELERKEDMKKRGVASPDRADALALALYDAGRGGFFVELR